MSARRMQTLRSCIGVGWALCLVLAVVAGGRSGANAESLRPEDLRGGGGDFAMVAFSVGQGNCTLVSCPTGDAYVMLDCGTLGSIANPDPVTEAARRAFDSIVPRQAEVSAVLLSHADKDHFSLVPRFVDRRAVGALYVSGALTEYTLGREVALDSWAAERGPAVVEFKEAYYNRTRGRVAAACSRPEQPGEGVFILGAGMAEGRNGGSMVSSVRFRDSGDGYVTLTYPGDAENGSLRNLVRSLSDGAEGSPSRWPTTLLVASHHGSGTKKSLPPVEFLAWTSPGMIVYSAGRHMGWKHPRCRTVERYQDPAVPLVTTAAHTLSCGIDGALPWLEPTRAAFDQASQPWMTTTDYRQGQFNTHDNGAVVLRYRHRSRQLSLYLCRKNDLDHCELEYSEQR